MMCTLKQPYKTYSKKINNNPSSIECSRRNKHDKNIHKRGEKRKTIQLQQRLAEDVNLIYSESIGRQ